MDCWVLAYLGSRQINVHMQSTEGYIFPYSTCDLSDLLSYWQHEHVVT